MKTDTTLPSALTIIKWIAWGQGKLKGHEAYMTKLQIINLCQKWLVAKGYKNG